MRCDAGGDVGPVRFCGNCGRVPCGPRPFSWDKRVLLLVYLRHVYFRPAVSCHVLQSPSGRPPCPSRPANSGLIAALPTVRVVYYYTSAAPHICVCVCVCVYVPVVPSPPRLLGPLLRPLLGPLGPILLTRLCFFAVLGAGRCVPLSLLLTNRPHRGKGCPGDQTLATGVNDQ